MGQCVACKSSKIRPSSESLYAQLSEISSTINKHLHTFHKISLECGEAISTCIASSNKPLAVLLKCKDSALRKKSSILRETIRIVDDALTLTKPQAQKEIIKEATSALDVSSLLLKDDVNIILQNSPEYIEPLNDEVKRLQINIKDNEAIIDAEFQERALNPEKNNRKRYVKNLASLS